MNRNTRKMTLAALFMALGLVLPFLTGQVPAVGKMLLPMHIPVLLCGFVCGWQYGLLVGCIVPIFRSMLFGMPIMMPTAVGMAFELGMYGLICGLLYPRIQILFRKAYETSILYISYINFGNDRRQSALGARQYCFVRDTRECFFLAVVYRWSFVECDTGDHTAFGDNSGDCHNFRKNRIHG